MRNETISIILQGYTRVDVYWQAVLCTLQTEYFVYVRQLLRPRSGRHV